MCDDNGGKMLLFIIFEKFFVSCRTFFGSQNFRPRKIKIFNQKFQTRKKVQIIQIQKNHPFFYSNEKNKLKIENIHIVDFEQDN